MTEKVEIQKLIVDAKARYAKLSSKEKREHDEAQMRSWMRSMKPTGDPKFD